jgi:hypothetical protein
MTPNVLDMRRAMVAVSPEVSRCLTSYPGASIAVVVTFAPSGEVTGAEVDPPGAPSGADGGPTTDAVLDEAARACVVAALQTARVPPFRQTTFYVHYPFHAP